MVFFYPNIKKRLNKECRAENSGKGEFGKMQRNQAQNDNVAISYPQILMRHCIPVHHCRMIEQKILYELII